MLIKMKNDDEMVVVSMVGTTTTSKYRLVYVDGARVRERIQTNDSSVYFRLRHSTSDYCFWLGFYGSIFVVCFHYFSLFPTPTHHAIQAKYVHILYGATLNYTLVNIDLALLYSILPDPPHR